MFLWATPRVALLCEVPRWAETSTQMVGAAPLCVYVCRTTERGQRCIFRALQETSEGLSLFWEMAPPRLVVRHKHRERLQRLQTHTVMLEGDQLKEPQRPPPMQSPTGGRLIRGNTHLLGRKSQIQSMKPVREVCVQTKHSLHVLREHTLV